MSRGSRFDVTKTEEIRPQVTTIANLQEWFGKPWSGRDQKDGTTKYVWQYTKAGFAVGIVEQRVLTVWVQNGLVRDFTVSQK